MSNLLSRPEDVAKVRDLEIREYMELVDAENHPVTSLRPLYGNGTGPWPQSSDKMLLAVLCQDFSA